MTDDMLRVPLDENQLFADWPEEDVHYEYEDSPEREPILFVRWDHMWSRIRAALAASATEEHDCSGPPDWNCPQCDAAASATDEGRCPHCRESASGVCTLHNGSAALAASATDADRLIEQRVAELRSHDQKKCDHSDALEELLRLRAALAAPTTDEDQS